MSHSYRLSSTNSNQHFPIQALNQPVGADRISFETNSRSRQQKHSKRLLERPHIVFNTDAISEFTSNDFMQEFLVGCYISTTSF